MSAPGPSRRPAFTMLELLVVLAIIAVTGLAVAPSLAGWGRDSDKRALRQAIIGLVRDAQIESTRRGVPIAVVLDADQGKVRAGERGEVALPRGWRIETGAPAPSQTPAAATNSAQPAPPMELFTWSPGGLASSSKWRAIDTKGRAIEVESDAIDGVRVR